MRSSFLTGIAAIAAAAVLSAATSPAPAALPQTTSATAALPKIAAQWHLNKDLSADMRDVTSPVPPPGGSTSTPVGGGYPGGGGGNGRIGGGYGGGYGGFGGGGGGGGGPTSERTLRDRAILREAGQAPNLLNIVVTGTTVTMTTDDGTVRKFTATGKKEKVDLTTAVVDSITRWDQNTLVQEMTNGDLKLTRSWQPTEEGNRLVMTVTTERNKRVEPVTVKLVYDK